MERCAFMYYPWFEKIPSFYVVHIGPPRNDGYLVRACSIQPSKEFSAYESLSSLASTSKFLFNIWYPESERLFSPLLGALLLLATFSIAHLSKPSHTFALLKAVSHNFLEVTIQQDFHISA